MTEINKALYLLTEKLQAWARQFIIMLPNLVIAILVLVVTFFAARLIRKGTEKLLQKVSQSVAINNLVSTLVYTATFLIGVFFALSILNLDKTVTSLLAGVGILGLALGFAFQDIAANFISGVIIAVRKPFGVGDVIETNNHFGTIERINMRTTDIRRQTGELVILPNRKIFENSLVNFTHYGLRRIDLDVGVSYGEDLDKVVAVTLEAMQNIRGQIETKEVEVVFEEFGDSRINFKVRFWIKFTRQTDYVYARSEAVMKIKQAYDQHNILIPYPVRTLDFNIRRGQSLSENLSGKQPESLIPPIEKLIPKPETNPENPTEPPTEKPTQI